MAFVVEKKKESGGARGFSPRPRRIAIELDGDDDEPEDDKPKSKLKFKPKGLRVEKLEDIEKSGQSLARKHREAEASLKSRREKESSERVRRGPPTSELKSDADALRQAVKRGQIKMIAKKASAESKDT